MSTTNIIIRCNHTGIYADGRTNTNPVLITDLDVGYENQLRKVPCYVPVGGHIDIPASSRSLLSFDIGVIHKFVQAGVITAKLYVQPEVYTNTNRPSASDFPAGVSIWNTDDNTLNWSDGVNWRDAQGNLV